MKRIIVTLMAILIICLAQAKVVNTTIQLKNVQSKQKVERVAKHLKGVTNAVYSSKYKSLYVSYDNKKTSASKIKTGLANAGYKTTTSQKSNGKDNQYKKSNQNNPQGNQNSRGNQNPQGNQNPKQPSRSDNSSTGSHHNSQPSAGNQSSSHKR